MMEFDQQELLSLYLTAGEEKVTGYFSESAPVIGADLFLNPTRIGPRRRGCGLDAGPFLEMAELQIKNPMARTILKMRVGGDEE
jgi:hypothetical protein